MKNKNNIVYSTHPESFYQSDDDHENSSSDFYLKVTVDRKQKGGKTVTIVEGYIGPESSLKDIEKQLKSKCGVGGTTKDRVVMIQGDHRDKVIKILNEMGFKTK